MWGLHPDQGERTATAAGRGWAFVRSFRSGYRAGGRRHLRALPPVHDWTELRDRRRRARDVSLDYDQRRPFRVHASARAPLTFSPASESRLAGAAWKVHHLLPQWIGEGTPTSRDTSTTARTWFGSCSSSPS